MAVTTGQLAKQLEQSSILTADQLLAVRRKSGLTDDGTSGEHLAKQLVRQGKLTKFQAQLAFSGKAKNLVMGSYVILEKLGEGGMGQVYKARHKRMKREVALKVLAPQFVKDEGALQRFHREVEAAARLNHQNIVTAYDADETRGTHYLVMEYVRGEDLSQIIKKSGPLAVGQAVNCVLQAATGLAYAHGQGVVHRDIKPSNLLYVPATKNDSAGTVKILDMGLARFDEVDADNAAALTGTGMLMGTIDYMAPEQAMDSKTADHRADIYSLGATLYYLITGQPMYADDTVMKRIMAHQTAEIPRLPIDDKDLQALFERMVAKKVGDRIDPAQLVVSELESWLARHQGGAAAANIPETSVSATSEQLGETVIKPAEDTSPTSSEYQATVVPQKPAIKPRRKPKPAKTVDRLAQSDVVVNIDAEAEPVLPSKRRTTRERRRKPNPSASGGRGLFSNRKLLMAGGGGLAALLLLGVILFRFPGKDGTVVVELAGDPKITSVEIDGREVSFTPAGSDKQVTFNVEAGSHELSLKTADGLELTTDLGKGPLEIKAGGSTTFKAWVEKTTASADESENTIFEWDFPPDAPDPAVAPFDAHQALQHQNEWVEYLGVPRQKEIEIGKNVKLRMALIPPGEFLMGTSKSEIDKLHQEANASRAQWVAERVHLEGPQHRAWITRPFFIGVNEVTVGQFRQFVNSTEYTTDAEKDGGGFGHAKRNGVWTRSAEAVWNSHYDFPGEQSEEHPVANVTLNDAEQFCIWLSDTTGETYRLPTEAEWEFACRAGSVGRFSFGDDGSQLHEYAWYGCINGAHTKPVGQKKPNDWGLFDIHGNAWERCLTGQESDFGLPVTQDADPSQQPASVMRGGASMAEPIRVRSAFRLTAGHTRAAGYGFRVMLADTRSVAARKLQSSVSEHPEPIVESAAALAPVQPNKPADLFSKVMIPVEEKNEATAPTAAGVTTPAVEKALGGLAPLELRMQPRAKGLLKFQNTLRAGQPLGEFAAVSRPGKVKDIVSWSIEPVLHRGGFRSIDVREDGVIVTGGNDGVLRVWTKDWQLVKILPGHANSVNAVQFSPDGKMLASVSSGPRDMLAVWDVDSGQLLKFHDVGNWQGHLAWTPDGTQILHISGTKPELIEPLTGKRTLPRDTDSAMKLGTAVAFSPDGERFVVGNESGSVHIVDTKTLSVVKSLRDAGAKFVDWSGDGKWIAIGKSQSVDILDTRSFQSRRSLDVGSFGKFAPDSTAIAVGGAGSVTTFSTSDWQKRERKHAGVGYYEFAWTPDSRSILTPAGIMDAVSGRITATHDHGSLPEVVTAVSDDGTRVATVTGSRMRIFDGEQGTLLREFPVPKMNANQLLWQPQGNLVLRVNRRADETPDRFILIDSETGKTAHQLIGHDEEIFWACWSPDGKQVASVGNDGTCRIWDASTGKQIRSLVHDDPLWWVVWDPSGARIATGSGFSAITVWDASDGTQLREFKTLSEPLPKPTIQRATDTPFAFLKNSNQIFYMAGSSFEMLDASTGQITSLGKARIPGGGRLSIGWSPDFGVMGLYCGYGEFHLIKQGEEKSVDVRYFRSPHWLTKGNRLLGGDNRGAWVSGYDYRRHRRLGVVFPELPRQAWATLSSNGHFVGSDQIESHIAVVAMHEDGRLLTLTPSEFTEHFGWTNDAKKVRFLH